MSAIEAANAVMLLMAAFRETLDMRAANMISAQDCDLNISLLVHLAEDY